MNKSLLFLVLLIGTVIAAAIGYSLLNHQESAGAFIQGSNRVIINQNYLLLDPATSANGTAIATFNGSGVVVTNSTGYIPDYPRNVRLNRSCNSASVTCGVTGTMTVTIKGTNIAGDIAYTESILLSANSTVYGNIAWYNITNVTWSASSVNESVSMGYGVKFGLPNLIKNNATDVVGVTVAGTGTAVSSQTFDLVNNTIQFSTAPNAANDYIVFYKGYGLAYQ